MPSDPPRFRTAVPDVGGILFGGDYNPEQWPRESWEAEIELLAAAGVNLVSVGIFSWVLLEPREGEYDFTFLDDLLELLLRAGVYVDLATPTVVPPAWFYRKYPQARAVTRSGTPLSFGSRGIVSPSSPHYLRAASAITEQLARRYAKHPAVVMWHVHNEYGAPIAESYDDASVTAFRRWLRERYGTLERLNTAWGTAFWGQRYGEWEEVDVPRESASLTNPSQTLDFRRFSSDALLACFAAERDIIRAHATQPVTTNFMVTECLTVDYWRWRDEVDVVSNDHYLTAARADNHVLLALDADLSRSLARGRPWILMEHSTSAVNWQPRNIAKRPGEMARNSLAHLARGADGILFFQVRASTRGAEKFHSAMLPHAGTDSRTWREVAELGSTLKALGEIRESTVSSRVAIAWDWNSFWAHDNAWRPSVETSHRAQIIDLYTVLWRLGVQVDLVHPADELSGFDVVFLPASYLIDDDAAENLRSFVAAGGVLHASYFSGIVSTDDNIPGAYPAQLRAPLGIVVEEFAPLPEGEQVELADGSIGRIWTDHIRLDGAVEVTRYATGPAANAPAVTRHSYGEGTGWYLSTTLDGSALRTHVIRVLADADLVVNQPPHDVERVVRQHEDGTTYSFVINHSPTAAEVGTVGVDVVTGRPVTKKDLVDAGGFRVVRG